jgi:hypothetical protein
MKISDDVINLFRKTIDVFGLAWIGECCRSARVTPRCATNPKINPPRIQRIEHTKDFGDLERTVMRQHHTATTDTNRLGARGDLSHHDFWTRSRKPWKTMMLSYPEPLIAQFFGCFS